MRVCFIPRMCLIYSQHGAAKGTYFYTRQGYVRLFLSYELPFPENQQYKKDFYVTASGTQERYIHYNYYLLSLSNHPSSLSFSQVALKSTKNNIYFST